MSHFDCDQSDRITLDDLETLLHDIANVKGEEFITSFTSGGSPNDVANNASTYSDLDASYSSQPGVSSAAGQRCERRLKEKMKTGKGSGGRKWNRPEARAVTDSSTIRQWRRQENVATRGFYNSLTSSDCLHGQIRNEDFGMNEYKSPPINIQDGKGVIETQASSELVVIKEHEEPSQTTVSSIESNSLRGNNAVQETLNPEMADGPAFSLTALCFPKCRPTCQYK